METETTRLITEWGGNYVTWATCENCGQTMQYHTERSFNFCPYCGKRVIYEQEEISNATVENGNETVDGIG